MAQYPVMGMPLWVTLIKIKIKVEEIIDAYHEPSFFVIYNLRYIRLNCQGKF
jgi:hypothetical protein